MASRTVYLISFRNIYSGTDPKKGTLSHAASASMTGYALGFKRNYSPLLA